MVPVIIIALVIMGIVSLISWLRQPSSIPIIYLRNQVQLVISKFRTGNQRTLVTDDAFVHMITEPQGYEVIHKPTKASHSIDDLVRNNTSINLSTNQVEEQPNSSSAVFQGEGLSTLFEIHN